MTTRIQFISFFAGMLLAVAVSSPAFAVNILTDPGFESNPLDTAGNVLGNFPTYQNIWGVEMASITGTDGGVTPFQGSNMLKMTDDGLTTTQGFQVVDVSAYSGLITSGATVNFTAMFDGDQNLSAPVAAVYVAFFTGNTYGTLTSQIGSGLTLDGNASTWEPISVSGVIPVGTTWIMAQVAYSDASLNGQGAKWGGYVDAADLSIRAVPEPGTMALCLSGMVGLFAYGWRKRR
jgi:hypothetical protein